MDRTVIVIVLNCLLNLEPILSTSEGECKEDRYLRNTLNLFLSSKRNRTGDWLTNFSLGMDDSSTNDLNIVTLDLSQGVSECRGKKAVHIRGVLTGISPFSIDEEKRDLAHKLLFHGKCSSNVAVLNNGKTIRKIDLDVDGQGVVFTRRPLRDNEILEITLDMKSSKFAHSLAIGVTTLSPENAPQLQHINSISHTSWAMYHGKTYYNGKEVVQNYGKNFNSLSVGDRVGVMRSSTGTLHYFVNGVDQGPAASNIPHPVYGVVELWGNAAMATIVHS